MKIAALISGGVDSAVAVHRLVEQGHDVTLFYIRIGLDVSEGGGCSAEEDIEMCTAIAARYGLPLEIVSLHQEYWDNVMEYAIAAVKSGLTPNPDVMCNRMIKFGFFEERWGKNFDRTATGHYANTVEVDGITYLATAPDPVKDQTDFLARITYSQLTHLMFPIGDMPKSDVREVARRQKLPNAYRRDSQGICFLGKIDYNEFLRRHLGENPGDIVDIESGRRLGTHQGFWFHTIGQRKGLGLSGGPWYVVKKDVESNTVYVSRGYDTELQYGRRVHLDEMHWISGNPWEGIDAPVEIAFKNRHSPEFLTGVLTPLGDGEYMVESDTKIQGIAPGQYGVIYSRDCRLCYGSGIITGREVTNTSRSIVL